MPIEFTGLVEFLLAAARDEDISTLSDEKLCRSQSNPFCAAGDDSNLTFELYRHRFSPLLLGCNELSTFQFPTLGHLSPSTVWPR